MLPHYIQAYIISITPQIHAQDKLKKKKTTKKQEAHGPWLANLSEIATADMQMLCNIFPILSLQLMKIIIWAVLGLKKNVFFFFFFYPYLTIYGRVTIWANSQSCFNSGIVEIGQLISDHDFIHVYGIGAREDKPRRIKCWL